MFCVLDMVLQVIGGFSPPNLYFMFNMNVLSLLAHFVHLFFFMQFSFTPLLILLFLSKDEIETNECSYIGVCKNKKNIPKSVLSW